MRIILSTGIVFLVTALAEAQFRPGGGPPGGGPPGGGTSGGFGGSSRFSMFSGGTKDPNQMFELLAKGRPYILISEMRSLREPLTQFAREQGITNDQVTRQQFATFFGKMDQYRSTGSSGGSPSGFGGRPPFGEASSPGSSPSPGSSSNPGQNPLEAIGQWAEADFKRRDQNGDGRLNTDEMQDSLRSQLDRWDSDRDGLMSLDEYKVYYSARLQMRDGPSSTEQPSNPITILIEEDYDRRPDVIRAGKLPKELPDWFVKLDADQDGQVALHEWHRGGKEIDEFRPWDRNDDGLLTAEEVIFRQKSAGTSLASATERGGPSFGRGEGERPSFSRGEGGDRRSGGDSGGRPSGPPGGFGSGGFFKKK